MTMLKMPKPETPLDGQESVWSYPRPPALDLVNQHLLLVFNGVVVAETRNPTLVKETSHPPVYFIRPEDVRVEYLLPTGKTSHCEWKGQAVYYDLVVEGERVNQVAFSYPRPVSRFEPIRDWISFYAGPLDEVSVDGEQVKPQEGGFYSGWITSKVAGPFKGAPGTWWW